MNNIVKMILTTVFITVILVAVLIGPHIAAERSGSVNDEAGDKLNQKLQEYSLEIPPHTVITPEEKLDDKEDDKPSEEGSEQSDEQLNEKEIPEIEKPETVKGIYLSGWTVNTPHMFENKVELAKETELNSFVIDTKDDLGKLTYQETEVELAQGKEAGTAGFDPIKMMGQLSEEDIYPIARVVVFKDDTMANEKPDWAIQHEIEGIWKDSNGEGWLDPYNKDVWNYIVELSKEAAELGFREVQFDYVRFPSDGPTSKTEYPSKDNFSDDTTEADVIAKFLEYAYEELEEYNIDVSADIFGMVTSSENDLTIGQNLEKLSPHVDLICPMIYPSHYHYNVFGLGDPNDMPYEVVYRGLEDGRDRLTEAEIDTAIRPWLQDFSWGKTYGPEDVRAQIQAGKDLGIEEFLLWNPGNEYTREALKSRHEDQVAVEDEGEPEETPEEENNQLEDEEPVE